MLDYSTAPRIRTHDGPCFKLADQSPKLLDHRNWPIILFPPDLLTASSENRQVRRLILYFWQKRTSVSNHRMILPHDIDRTRNKGVPVNISSLPPKRSLSLSEDKCSPNSMASIPEVTILWYDIINYLCASDRP